MLWTTLTWIAHESTFLSFSQFLSFSLNLLKYHPFLKEGCCVCEVTLTVQDALICTQCHNDTVIVTPLCWLQVTYCDTDSIRLHQKCFFHFTLPHGHSTWPDSNPNFLPTFEILSFLHSCIASQQFLAYVACTGVTANRQASWDKPLYNTPVSGYNWSLLPLKAMFLSWHMVLANL